MKFRNLFKKSKTDKIINSNCDNSSLYIKNAVDSNINNSKEEPVDNIFSSSELELLRYIDMYKVGKTLPGYFTYQHKLDVDAAIEKLFEYEMLTYADIQKSMEKSTVAELKDFAIFNNIKVKGTKSDIITQIMQLCNETEVDKYFSKKYYKVTEKGKEYISKNTTGEDYYSRYTYVEYIKKDVMSACIDSVLSNNYTNIYSILNEDTCLKLTDAQPAINEYFKLYSNNYPKDELAFFVVESIRGRTDETGIEEYSDYFGKNITKLDFHFYKRSFKSITEYISMQDTAQKLKGTNLHLECYVNTMVDGCVCPACRNREGKVFDILTARMNIDFPPFKDCTCNSDGCRCLVTAKISE